MNSNAMKFAFIDVLNDFLHNQGCDCTVDKSPAYESAHRTFEKLEDRQQTNYRLAARSTIQIIQPQEPRLWTPFGNETLLLLTNSDSADRGTNEDMRDIICLREQGNNKWEIGCSFKHEWYELKKVRMPLDFGTDWLGIPCSKEFINSVKSNLSPLSKYTPQTAPYWNTFPDKFDRFYVPLLQTYIDEIKRLCVEHEDVPAKLASYFFGSNGFYIIVGKANMRGTDVQGVNSNGDLTQNAGKIRPNPKIKTISLPTELYNIDFKNDRRKSKTTIALAFNNGWSFDMRLHTQKRKATVSSLAWDIIIAGRPAYFCPTIEFWDAIT